MGNGYICLPMHFMKSVFSSVVFLVLSVVSSAQVMVYGTNNYVGYRSGTLPIVISVPHGGSLQPSTIPDRTCNNPVYDQDANTIEMAQAIDSALTKYLMCSPHIIYNFLDRAKMDANRNLADGACGNAEAATAWNEFHNFIDQAQTTASNFWNNKVLYIDLHGHGNPIARIELGYLLYDDELDFSDSVLNTTTYINYSTIRNLVSNNDQNYTHAQLLRGDFAFGTLLGNKGFPAVPSQQIPAPGINNNYYSGGYNVAHHTSYVTTNTVNGFQMELNYAGIRDNAANRTRFADSLAQTIVQYFNKHRFVNFAICGASVDDHTSNKALYQVPSYIKSDCLLLPVKHPEQQVCQYQISNAIGQKVIQGKVQQHRILLPSPLPSGLYLVQLLADNGQLLHLQKMIVE